MICTSTDVKTIVLAGSGIKKKLYRSNNTGTGTETSIFSGTGNDKGGIRVGGKSFPFNMRFASSQGD